MKIALFPSAFHPHFGGVEELVRQFARELKGLGHIPEIFTNRWPKSLLTHESFEGLRIRRWAFRVPEHSWRQMLGYLALGPATLRRICTLLQRDNVQILHVQCVSSNAHYAVRVRRRLRIPLVVTLQGELTMDAGAIFQHSRFARTLMREVLSEADHITACSEQTLNEAEEFYGQSFGARATVIYNGIRLSEFQTTGAISTDRPYILAIGRHVPQKGFDVLLQALAELRCGVDAVPDLVLAGDGPENGRLRALALELGIADSVRFVGRVDRTRAAQLFSACQFFVLPSRHEPMGIVNLEAMASGKAVIASKVGGVPELVEDGITGLLVPGGDAQALTCALGRLVGDRALRDRLGEEGRVRSAAFDWAHIAKQYVAIYEALPLPVRAR